MIGFESNIMGLVGGFISFLLTIFVLSYAFGDNHLFRFAIHIFIGVSAGFVAVAAFYLVIWPYLIRPLVLGSIDERLSVLFPLIMSILLLGKAYPRYTFIGSPVMAFLVGVGAATIIGGALLGTLIPQLNSSISLFENSSFEQTRLWSGNHIINSGLILFGTIVSFASFQFGTRFLEKSALRIPWKIVYWSGRIFIVIAFGVIFAGVLSASLAALVERFQFMIDFILGFIAPAS